MQHKTMEPLSRRCHKILSLSRTLNTFKMLTQSFIEYTFKPPLFQTPPNHTTLQLIITKSLRKRERERERDQG